MGAKRISYAMKRRELEALVNLYGLYLGYKPSRGHVEAFLLSPDGKIYLSVFNQWFSTDLPSYLPLHWNPFASCVKLWDHGGCPLP